MRPAKFKKIMKIYDFDTVQSKYVSSFDAPFAVTLNFPCLGEISAIKVGTVIYHERMVS